MHKKIKFEELSKEEQEVLKQVYGLQFSDARGYNPQKIIYVEEINNDEKTFFDKNR